MTELNEELTYRAGVTEKLSKILFQTEKTNGSVGKLAERVTALERWQSYVVGGVSVITILLVPILIYFTKFFLHL